MPAQSDFRSSCRLKLKNMKTDSLLTVEQYLDKCRLVPTLAKSPARNARHVLVEPTSDVDLAIEPQARTCDRWGHPYDDCVDTKLSSEIFGSETIR